MKRRWLCSILAVCMVFALLPGLSLRTSAYEEMKVSQELVDVVKVFEGFSAKPYKDGIQYTFGYGSRCPDDLVDHYTEVGITREEAEVFLRQDMDDFEKEVNDYAKKYKLTFSQQQFDALVSLSFNCGGNWKWETYGILNHAIRNGATGNELIYAFGLYSKAHKNYQNIRRRLNEANIFLNGVYVAFNDKNPEGAIPDNYKYIFLDGNGGEVAYAIHAYDASEKPGITATFTSIPTGVDENGNTFVYEFAGWYTASTGGKLVEKLDGSLKNKAMLYAQWKDPAGNIVELPKGEKVESLRITTTDKRDVYTGPGAYYTKLKTLAKGESVELTEVYTNSNGTWGKYADGWLNLDYTDYESVLESLKPEPVWPRGGTVTGDNVNVRTGPGTDNPVQYQMFKGDRVLISEIYDDGKLVWGKLEDGNWICVTYVKYDPAEGEEQPPAPYITGITLLRLPDQVEYVQMQDDLNVQGSVLQVQYSDGTIEALTLTKKMIAAYSNSKLGETTVKIAHQGFTASFTVTIIPATVTFLNEDGTVLSQTQYAYGETVIPPEVPPKAADEAGEYTFAGWSPELTACNGNATYTAVFELLPEVPEVPAYVPGDFDGNELVDENDADYLLGYLLFPEWYPITIPGDLDGNEVVDENDADYLLGYLLFPEWYPLPEAPTVPAEPEVPDTGTEETPGTGTEETPGTGTEETPGTGTEETPDTGTEETPGTGTEETPGTGTEETPDTGTEETPDTGTDVPPDEGTGETDTEGSEVSA